MKREPETEQDNPEPGSESPDTAQVIYLSPVRAGHGGATPFMGDDNLFGDAWPAGEQGGDHWSVPWSDLMMVMFVLFAALLTAQALERRVPEPVPSPVLVPSPVVKIEPEPVPEPVDSEQVTFEPLMRINVFERSQQAIRETEIENVEIAILEDQSVKVSVQGPMFFELGKADLRRDMREFLSKLARIIMQTPYHVNVVGHTDDYPINTDEFPSNWELSVTRAARVARYLVEQEGVDPTRFTVMGRSEFDPLLPNTDDSARAQNRRVEIIITREISTAAGDNP